MIVLTSVSCSVGKKARTITETVTVIKIDTVIKFVPDTVLKLVSVLIQDTAEIETESAIARSYFNIKTQKIELTLKGKIIDVPVIMNQTIKTKEKKFESERRLPFAFYMYMFIFFITVILLSYIFYKFKSKT